MRTQQSHHISNPQEFKRQLLLWSQQFDSVVWLDSNNYGQNQLQYDAILAVDEFTSIQTDYEHAFDKLKEYQSITNDWVFGYLAYDLKNNVEALKSENFDGLEFPDLYFFQPQKLFLLKGDTLQIKYLRMVDDEINIDLIAINNIDQNEQDKFNNDIKIHLRIHKDEYFNKLHEVLNHIHRGDIYEANFCQEFYAIAKLNPLKTYFSLNSIAQTPFATFLKNGSQFLLSSSPERYIKKEGSIITSQPIKGTTRRSDDISEDEKLKFVLKI